MRHKTGPAFLNALAIQRRRIQQGFQPLPENASEPEEMPAEVTELTVLLEGPHGPERHG